MLQARVLEQKLSGITVMPRGIKACGADPMAEAA
jgi:hypothetical protein